MNESNEIKGKAELEILRQKLHLEEEKNYILAEKNKELLLMIGELKEKNLKEKKEGDFLLKRSENNYQWLYKGTRDIRKRCAAHIKRLRNSLKWYEDGNGLAVASLSQTANLLFDDEL